MSASGILSHWRGELMADIKKTFSGQAINPSKTMKQTLFTLSVLLLMLLFSAHQWNQNRRTTEADAFRKDFLAAWQRSEEYTLAIAEAMPERDFNYRYCDTVFTFSTQFTHCVSFTCGQIAGRTGVKNPYEGRKLKDLTKAQVLAELKSMYAFIARTAQELPAEKLYSKEPYAGGEIPVWRLFYAMENHIIHHRGQAIVYLRLKGIRPKGYVGW